MYEKMATRNGLNLIPVKILCSKNYTTFLGPVTNVCHDFKFVSYELIEK